jgi:hypothetical protein
VTRHTVKKYGKFVREQVQIQIKGFLIYIRGFPHVLYYEAPTHTVLLLNTFFLSNFFIYKENLPLFVFNSDKGYSSHPVWYISLHRVYTYLRNMTADNREPVQVLICIVLLRIQY